MLPGPTLGIVEGPKLDKEDEDMLVVRKASDRVRENIIQLIDENSWLDGWVGDCVQAVLQCRGERILSMRPRIESAEESHKMRHTFDIGVFGLLLLMVNKFLPLIAEGAPNRTVLARHGLHVVE